MKLSFKILKQKKGKEKEKEREGGGGGGGRAVIKNQMYYK